MWAFWPLPDYHQMGHRQQQQQLGPATLWGVGGGGGGEQGNSLIQIWTPENVCIFGGESSGDIFLLVSSARSPPLTPSAVSEGAGDGPTRAWDLSLIPHSSSQLAGVIISLPVKYYRPVVSA
ncbi:unnamed protein product [Pleuronectes platessa]|uniref:Uncharacterized protein n=1 Tax=Pleuronectes platessa TaxID=8262 RepID=A0A9N7YLR3_PLEPL|nr:unnamed protein product [Pleuronectes platessa]